jgi:hypothetical protein
VIFPTAERVKPREIAGIFLLTAAAILVHGYHPFVEDAEIYVPGIKKLLNPAFYPFNDGFFASHARLTLFPNLIAGSVRITHLPFEWVLLTWHFACIFLLLLACWKLGQICLGNRRAAWGSAGLVAALLTIPVAGTALYIMDQYLNTRSFSTTTVMWVVVATIQRKYRQAATWLVLTVLIHPLMAGFGLVFAGLLIWRQHTPLLFKRQHAAALMLFPVTFFPPVTSAYRQVLNSHSYFFLLRWEWYEWLGIAGPLIILWWFARIAQRKNLDNLRVLCSTSIVFGVFFFAIGLVITIPPQFTRFVELQPMRGLHLIYVLLFAISGGLLAEQVLKAKLWRWLTVFLPLCAGMFYAQRQLFPATPHIELPGRNPHNQWVEAFVWIRDNTPVNAYFALDPDHMRSLGEDQHGFRAIAERSRLADRVKDSGAVTMFPALATSWLEQVNSEEGWKNFGAGDFETLHQKYGVDWVVLQQPGVAGMGCPYRNPVVLVCLVG